MGAINLLVGACVTGLQLASANVPQDRKHLNTKTKWVTEIKTVKGQSPHPTDFPWAGPYDGKPKHPRDGSKVDNDKLKKHHKKPHKGSKDDKPKHHKAKGKGKHQKNENDEPHRSNQDKPGRTKGTTPKYDDKNATPGKYPAGYQSEVIQFHNVHRANHTSPNIQWSDSLAAKAANIAKGCVYGHVMGVDGGHYGQNIAAGVTSAGISHIISDQFYNAEINDFGNQYGDAHPTGFESWGHFSQLIWKNTDHVGCATQYCPNGLGNTGSHVKPYFTVCNYSPPGNVGGQYGKNIGKPLGRPTVRGHVPKDSKKKHH